MLVKLTSSIAGDRFSFQAGSVIDMPKEEAKRFIDKGLAVPHTPAPEKAMAWPKEMRARRRKAVKS